MMPIKEMWRKGVDHRAFRPVVGAVSVMALLLILRSCGDGGEDGQQPVFVVERGPLTISFTESGSLKAREQAVIKSEVEGQTSILFIVEEGTPVTNGLLLVELDSSKLDDSKINQQIHVQNAEAAHITATENLEVVKNKSQSDVERAELNQQFAELDLKKYMEGDYQRELKEANTKISLAEQDLERAREKLKWSRILYDEEYLSESEKKTDELVFNKAELDLDLAKDTLRVLQEYSHQRTVAELESEVRQTGMALERGRRKASADVVQAEASLRAKASEFLRQKDKLEKILDQIDKTKIYAPADGLVVYATSSRGGWRGNDEPMAEGRMVREREELIHLPTTFSYQAIVKIHESTLQVIHTGCVAAVKVGALPDKVFAGKVVRIAPLPDATSMFWNPDLKVYSTEVHLDEVSQDIKTGMNCEVEIFVAHYKDVLFVPVQAVLSIGGKPTVYVRKGRKFVPREVDTGLDNNRMVHVISGLEPGDRVLLTPPLDKAGLEDEERVPDGLSADATSPPAENRRPSSDSGAKGGGKTR